MIIEAPLNTIFKFDDEILKELNIPKIDKIENYDELWTYCKYGKDKMYDKSKIYMVSTYGRVYNIPKMQMLKEYTNPLYKSSINYYRFVNIYFYGKEFKMLIHRLVAMAFLPKDKSRPFVNHIDANPGNNYLWNLEWCNASENYHHALEHGLIKEINGEDRYNALWTNEEIEFICSLIEEGHKATYIYNILGDVLKDPKVEYERVRTLYKHIIHQTHWKSISCKYNIDFSKYNYKKEKSSVEAASQRNV